MTQQNARPKLLWTPSADIVANANLTRYERWLNDRYQLGLSGYPSLWRWSVTDVELFWQTIWAFCGVVGEMGETALVARQMPGAVWFPDARLNYAENIFAKRNDAQAALLYEDEAGGLVEISWATLAAETAAFQQALIAMGVTKGDRVVAYLPNIPEAIVACLAAVSLGAIWSSASPDFGSKAVLDRFAQIEPKVLIAVDGYQYGGRPFNRRDVVQQLQNGLTTVEQTVLIPHLNEEATLPNSVNWSTLLSTHQSSTAPTFTRVPFDHPLWILYSSGTTGLPKPIVHGHGGNLLEHIKAATFHNDLKPSDRFCWFTSTGWMMWNYQLGTLLTGCTAVLYNGSPAYPTLNRLWNLAERARISYLGISPAFIAACMKAGLVPGAGRDFSALRGIGSTGAPLTAEAFEWVYENVKPDLALESLSGGTDLCTAFVGGARTQPVYSGEIQGASLGAKVEAFDAQGEAVIGEMGELVISEPMPSMPLYFWNDPEGDRYRASYFEVYPNVWRHGDWIQFNERGGCVIYGRSDSTINRKGIRMGTSEIYACVEALDAVLDSLVVDLELLGRDSFMPLFVILREGVVLDDALKKAINDALRTQLSPRHVPNEIYQVAQIPYTLSGKKLEIPVRRVLLGQPIEKAANLGAMRNPESIDFFAELGKKLAG